MVRVSCGAHSPYSGGQRCGDVASTSAPQSPAPPESSSSFTSAPVSPASEASRKGTSTMPPPPCSHCVPASPSGSTGHAASRSRQRSSPQGACCGNPTDTTDQLNRQTTDTVRSGLSVCLSQCLLVCPSCLSLSVCLGGLEPQWQGTPDGNTKTGKSFFPIWRLFPFYSSTYLHG